MTTQTPTTEKPYTITERDGPLGSMHTIEGPGGYCSSHGGGKDDGKMAAKMHAAELNAAYAHGAVGKADLLAALIAIRDGPQFRDRLENSIQQIVHAAIAKATT